jgi:5-methylcytosine-specific restriction endonuclease McrA
MLKINNPVSYSETEAAAIKAKIADPQFTHKSWSSDDLMAIRSAIRDHYKNQQNGLCAYCRNPISIHDALNCHVEHIAPKSIYPDFIFEPKNLCVICSDCNAIKRNQEVMSDEPNTIVNRKGRKHYPRSSTAFFIVHPHFDNWDEHLQIFGKYYVDKSEKGHFTIGACVLNRHLRKFGWEPPLVNNEDLRTAMTCYLNTADAATKTSALLRLMRLMAQL